MSLVVDIKKCLGDFTLSVRFAAEDGIMGILGPSGCGKSMTLRCIAGVEKPDEGRIELDGVTLFDSKRRVKPQAAGAERVGYLFQNYALFPNMDLLRQNIMCGLRQEKDRARAPSASLQKYLELMQLAGLENHLSGAALRRAAAARGARPHTGEPAEAPDARRAIFGP